MRYSCSCNSLLQPALNACTLKNLNTLLEIVPKLKKTQFGVKPLAIITTRAERLTTLAHQKT
jgi:hypothetical protein